MSKSLSNDEKLLLVDAYNGVMLGGLENIGIPNEYDVYGMIGNVEDSILIDKLDKKWNVDGNALISKLIEMSNQEKTEILINIHKFWDEDKRDWAYWKVHND